MNLNRAVKSALNFLPLGLLALIIWLLVRGGSSPANAAASGTGAPSSGTVSLPPETKAPSLPQAELEKYAAFDFPEVFKLPAGPQGFEYTDKLLALADSPVRIEGFMVRHSHDDPEIFLFTRLPMMLNQRESGLADDLPPNVVHVRMESPKGEAPVWTREKLLICGQLAIGPHQEKDGRISHLRLQADHILRASDHTPVSLLKPIIVQPERVRASLSASGQ